METDRLDSYESPIKTPKMLLSPKDPSKKRKEQNHLRLSAFKNQKMSKFAEKFGSDKKNSSDYTESPLKPKSHKD